MRLLALRISALSMGLGCGVSSLCQLSCPAATEFSVSRYEWRTYGRDPGGMRYSPLTQINRDTVSRLKVAWTFHTGDVSDGKGNLPRSGFETTPVVLDGR